MNKSKYKLCANCNEMTPRTKTFARDENGNPTAATVQAHIASPASDTTKKFIANYKAKYGTTPDDVAALTYDSFGLLWQALKTAGKNDRQAVRDALARIPQYEGVTGNMQFKEGSGDPVKSAVILKIKDGKFTWFANAKP